MANDQKKSQVIFTRARREKVPLVIMLAGPSGSGKTYSAMRIAAGIAGGSPFAVIDSENRRALHYADKFMFDHVQIEAPYSCEKYIAAIKAADDAGYPAIVIDSYSHAWEGEGGVLDSHEVMIERKVSPIPAWKMAKEPHAKLVAAMQETRASVIVCIRSAEKYDDGKSSKKPSAFRSDGFSPICEKSLPFIATVYLAFHHERAGVPTPLKIQDQHRALLTVENGRVSEGFGKGLHAWANSGAEPARATSPAPVENVYDAFDTDGALSRIKALSDETPAILQAINRFVIDEIGFPGGWRDAKKDADALKKILDKFANTGSEVML